MFLEVYIPLELIFLFVIYLILSVFWLHFLFTCRPIQ